MQRNMDRNINIGYKMKPNLLMHQCFNDVINWFSMLVFVERDKYHFINILLSFAARLLLAG